MTDTVAIILTNITGDHARVRTMDQLGLKRADLVEAAAARGIATNGTRSNIAYRIAREG